MKKGPAIHHMPYPEKEIVFFWFFWGDFWIRRVVHDLKVHAINPLPSEYLALSKRPRNDLVPYNRM